MRQPPLSVLFNPDVGDAVEYLFGLAVGAWFFGGKPACQHGSFAVKTHSDGAPLTFNCAEAAGLFGLLNGPNLLSLGQWDITWRGDRKKILAQHCFERCGVAAI